MKVLFLYLFNNLQIPYAIKGPLQPSIPLYLHIINLTPKFSLTDLNTLTMFSMYSSNLRFGLITPKELPKICDFPLYVSAGEINVSLEVNHNLSLTEENLQLLQSFHYLIFNDVLKILKKFLVFDKEYNEGILLLAPVIKRDDDYVIDFNVVKEKNFVNNPKTEPTVQERLSMRVTEENYINKIVMPWYRPDETVNI